MRVSCERFDNVHPADALPLHLLAVLLVIRQLLWQNPRLWQKTVLGRMRPRHSTVNKYWRKMNQR